MESKKISVLMSNYNHGHYLKRSLAAIVQQSYPPEELIIIDDASTDDSLEIIRQFCQSYPFIRLIEKGKNQGIMSNLEELLRLAQGEYIYFAAADDVIWPGLFEKSISLLSQYPQAGLCCVNSVTLFPEGRSIPHNRNLSAGPCFIPAEKLIKIMRKRILYLSCLGSVVRHSAVKEVGMLPDLKWSSDRILTLVIALRYGLCYLPETLVSQNYRSDTYSVQGLKDYSRHNRVIESILDLLKKQEFEDVLPRFKKSAALSSLGTPLLGVILKKKSYFDYMSFTLLKLILGTQLRDFFGEISPPALKYLYRFLKRKIGKIIT